VVTEKKQIFIVDDDESVCRALSILLGTYGFNVDTFTSAVKFLSVVADSAPGCLILDIHMPMMDGWQVLEQLPPLGRRRPFIMRHLQPQLCTRSLRKLSTRLLAPLL